MKHVVKLEGRIPSKKNTRISTKSGRTFPSKSFQEWHRDALLQLYGQTPTNTITTTCRRVILSFRPPDRRKWDLTNKAESVMDLLVDGGILEDDNYTVVPELLLKVEQGSPPGVIIEIIID